MHEESANELKPKKISRRRLLKMGLVGIGILGGAVVTPAGRGVIQRINEDFSREIKPVSFKPAPSGWLQNQVTIAWLGHASFLINFFGTRILIDPVLSNRIGVNPLGNFVVGPKRYIEPALTAEEVGTLDLLLVSHAHMDHFDYPTLAKIQSPSTEVVTAKNTTSLWNPFQYKRVHEMHWADVKEISGVTIKAIEGKHWGARFPWNKEMEANSFLISKNGVNIFFGADTGYAEKIGEQLRDIPIDVAILGIGAYSPKSYEAKHATPEQAWKIAEDIGTGWVIPMHWGSFKISQEPMDEPMARFVKAAEGKLDKIAIKETGATWVLRRG